MLAPIPVSTLAFLLSQKSSDKRSFLIIYIRVFMPKNAKPFSGYVSAAAALPAYAKKESFPEHIRRAIPRGYVPKPKSHRPNIYDTTARDMHFTVLISVYRFSLCISFRKTGELYTLFFRRVQKDKNAFFICFV